MDLSRYLIIRCTVGFVSVLFLIKYMDKRAQCLSGAMWLLELIDITTYQ